VSFRQLWAVTRKEFQHIFRDTLTFITVLLSPLFLLFIMAYALTVDLKDIPIAVLDGDRSQVSRSFINRITAGEDLTLYAYVDSIEEIEMLLLQGKIKAAVILHPSFGEQIQTFTGMPMQVIVDGTEPQSGGFAVDHIGQRAEIFIEEMLTQQLNQYNLSPQALHSIDLRVRTWYNPSLKSQVDLIPGLISMVLGMPAISVALTLAHEHEHGTMEQLMATPVGRTELLLGKMIPYILIGMANVVFIPLLSIWWFNIPFNGNFFVYLLLSGLFLFAILSLGIVLGVFIRTQAAALALAFLVVFFPGFFLTGIFFPLPSMPEIVRMEAMVLPGTHYTIITRGVFVTGIGLEILWPNALMLIGLGVGFIALAALFFRKKLG
jgi:ABC-2 type transport system permease protein